MIQFIVQLAEFEKYAVVTNLCILESLEKVILERCFKLLEKCFKLLEKCFKLLVFVFKFDFVLIFS